MAHWKSWETANTKKGFSFVPNKHILPKYINININRIVYEVQKLNIINGNFSHVPLTIPQLMNTAFIIMEQYGKSVMEFPHCVEKAILHPRSS
jgi:hypothetical protein